ncbi:MAG: DUF296 domain-containing protein [Sulfolobales archaeon]|nr:DUF296 domain-containing protein [Sulfolobales archaeon]MCX8198895.1 DUF296 domain-containing protein [Sulfolobales archaeon]MDW8170814.1 DUF296 domain-containing protein [Desulfurococcaceae archaeon]
MEFKSGRFFLLRVPSGSELVNYIRKYVKDLDISTGIFWLIGSFHRAKIGFFIEEEGSYKTIDVNEFTEVINASGNISLVNGEPFIHVHVALGRMDGSCIGGHLIEGIVYIAEVWIQELIDEELKRVKEGSLHLWPLEQLPNELGGGRV